MKLKILLGGFFALTLLFSCSDEVRIKRKKNRVVLKPSLIRMSHYFTEFEDEVSFPVWFDDSLIRENRIKKIVRKTFLLNEDTLALQLPKTVKEYGFEENGRIISFEVIQFYEGREVSTMKFTYPKGIDEYGFAEVKTSVPDKVLDQSQYRIYQPEKYATDFLVYRNVSEGTYLFCMTNEAYFGPLSVDSILKPTSYDLVMLGSPIYPLKRYRVENRVNESDVVELEYDRKTNLPKKLKMDKSPFIYHRVVQYDRNGICNGFIDSTFSIDQLLTVRKSSWRLNENGNPKRVIHVSDTPNNELKNIQIETFDYEYFQ